VHATDGSDTKNNVDPAHFPHSPVHAGTTFEQDPPRSDCAGAASEPDSPTQVSPDQLLGADPEPDLPTPAATASPGDLLRLGMVIHLMHRLMQTGANGAC
jgi:hypothetical protein